MSTGKTDPEGSVAQAHLRASAQLKLRCADELADIIDKTAAVILATFQRGNKLLTCGNGGSAADAQHLASELVGRFLRDRRALPAIALTTDVSALTAISNDYGFDHVFERQVQAHGVAGDVLVAISTSGQSQSIVLAARAARAAGCMVIGLTGRDGGLLARECDHAIIVPSEDTALIQEVHESILHSWGAVVEAHYLLEKAEGA